MKYLWKLQVIQSWDEVDDPVFLERWKKWVNDSPDVHVFNHPVMVKAWTDNYRILQDISPLYIIAETEGIKIFLPLVLWKRNWKNAFLRMIVPAGYSDYDYHDPLTMGYAEKQLMVSFWNMLEERVLGNQAFKCDIVELTGMRSPGEGGAWSLSGETCPYATLSEYRDYADYISKIKKSLRQDIGRQKKRLGQQGLLEYYLHSSLVTEDLLTSFRMFMSTHAGKWPNAYKAPGFHEALLQKGIPEGLVHFSELRLDGHPVSWHLGFLFGGRFYYYMPAYLEEFSNYSPGKVHLAALVEECFERGILIFDHLRGAENYKAGWTGDAAHVHCYNRRIDSLPSRLRLSAYDTIQELKR